MNFAKENAVKVVPKGGSIPLLLIAAFYLRFNRNLSRARYRDNRIDAIERIDRTDDRQFDDTLDY